MKLERINSKKGFSLIELMIVVAIIGILAAIAVPNFARFQRKARQSEARGLLGSYHTALKASAADAGCFMGNFVAIGYQPEGQLNYRFTTKDFTATCVPPAGTPTLATCIVTTVDCSAAAPAGFGVANSWVEKSTAVATTATPVMTANTYLAAASSNLGGAQVAVKSLVVNR